MTFKTNTAHALGQFIDLAPEITRQRLVIEGYPVLPVSAEQIAQYLSELSPVINMNALGAAVTHRSPKFGWAGWIHWETSGAHFYAWDSPRLFFSVDIYTCKAFEPSVAVDFTASFFSAKHICYKSF